MLCNQPIHWVEDKKTLDDLCTRWRACKILAVDTEFMRSQTYYPIAALLQVNDGEANYLIDPTVIQDCSAFGEMLTDINIVKILHSCSEDLDVFQHLLGVIPVKLFDTQIAAALCGYGFSVGYGNLVKAVLDKDLPKSETRSDWLQRPLSTAQIDYAAIDVEDLFQLAQVLILKLKNLDRLFWATDDCEQVLTAFGNNQGDANSYLRIKQAWRLSRKNLTILKALAQWREGCAKNRDVPRNRVIKEHSLMDIASAAPSHISQLRAFEGLTDRMIRTDGENLITVVQAALEQDVESYPALIEKPLTSSENKWAKKMRACVGVIAEEQNVAPELLMKKRDYEAITRRFFQQESDNLENILEALKSHISGWRYDLLSEPLAQTICGEIEE
ncbi:ribonuclease D [Teredinibacter haidensis]|uniref:ribonuclease D n=1 Tax=Teredinibacter haidensis TaxID=2731755 RepID=UPI001FECFF4E|nr:ribonuclease D [Teredinibacter haidensis]